MICLLELYFIVSLLLQFYFARCSLAKRRIENLSLLLIILPIPTRLAMCILMCDLINFAVSDKYVV